MLVKPISAQKFPLHVCVVTLLRYGMCLVPRLPRTCLIITMMICACGSQEEVLKVIEEATVAWLVMVSSWSGKSRIPHHTSTWFHSPFLAVSLSTWTTSVKGRGLSQHTALAQHLRLRGGRKIERKKKTYTWAKGWTDLTRSKEITTPEYDVIERTASK